MLSLQDLISWEVVTTLTYSLLFSKSYMDFSDCLNPGPIEGMMKMHLGNGVFSFGAS